MDFRVLPVTALQQNCTLFWCPETRQAAIIDPGGEPSAIEGAITALGLTPTRVLLTHGHIDHVGASADMAERYGIPIQGPHREDAFLIDALGFQSQMFGFPPIRQFQPDTWLDAGDVVEIGEQRLEVIHCPGHTPGHIVFFDRAAKLAQVGDVLFQGSIGRTDFPRGSHADLISSIKDRLFSLGDDIRFVPGHGPMSTFGHERKTNPFVRG